MRQITPEWSNNLGESWSTKNTMSYPHTQSHLKLQKKTDVWWHLEFQVAHFSSTAHFWIHINIGRWNAYPAWIDNMLKENKEKQPNLKNNYIWLLFCIAAGVSNLIMEVPFTQEKDTRVSKDQHYTVYRIPIPKNVPKSSNHHPGNFFFWGGDYYKKNSQLISN